MWLSQNPVNSSPLYYNHEDLRIFKGGEIKRRNWRLLFDSLNERSVDQCLVVGGEDVPP